jgi:hypothetical protein
MNAPRTGTSFPVASQEALEARFALRLAARLTEQSNALPPDLTERLRFAREQALGRARLSRASVTAGSAGQFQGSAMALHGPSHGEGPSWWKRAASVLPLVALLAGLLLIQESNRRAQIAEAADIDAALLSDDLPPLAYSDPGFVEFLNTASADE